MLVLITGATGFVGSHLVEYLERETDWELAGISRTLRHAGNLQRLSSRLRLSTADLNEPASIESAIAAVRPDGIIHLAGQPLEPISWLDPAATFRINVIGLLNLIQATLKCDLRPRIVLGGSALMYGLVKDEENPINESQLPRPASPYAVSKLAADYTGYQYFLSHHLPIVRLRPFNQLGPRQSPDFAVAAFAQQIAEIEAGKREPILRVGNLAAARDFLDVRDAAAAYRAALERGEAGEAYNVGSGEAHTMDFILHKLLELSSATIGVERDEARFRPVDLPRIVCDAGKFRRATGWQPSIPLERSLFDTLQYWRQQTSRS